MMFKLKTWIWTVSLLFIQTFILCVLWNMFEPKPIYIHILETVLPGFQWLSPLSFLLGLLETFLYGAYFACSFVLIHNFFYRRHEQDTDTTVIGKKAA